MAATELRRKFEICGRKDFISVLIDSSVNKCFDFKPIRSPAEDTARGGLDGPAPSVGMPLSYRPCPSPD